jgi:hypothetical protein
MPGACGYVRARGQRLGVRQPEPNADAHADAEAYADSDSDSDSDDVTRADGLPSPVTA